MGELYHSDLVLWAAQQAEALRAAAREGSNAVVDWANVAEEIESLGASERRALASHVRIVLEHLMKLQASPAPNPRREWRATITRARADIAAILKDSPSLRREVPEIIMRESDAAQQAAKDALEEWEEPSAGVETFSYDAGQVLERWFPD